MTDRSSVTDDAALESTAETPVWLTLGDGEAIRWYGSPRIQSSYPWLAIGVLGIVVAGLAIGIDGVPIVVAAIGPIALVPAGWGYLSVARTAFVVTTESMYVRSGVLGTRVTTATLERVQNSSFEQHALGRLVGYGTITVDTAGGDGEELRFWNVENPQTVRALIDEHVDRARDGTVPGTVEQWEAVLAEVRGWRERVEGGR